MTQSQDEQQEMLTLFAGIALPGIIGTKGGTTGIETIIAKQAFDVAQAMVDEYVKRVQTTEN